MRWLPLLLGIACAPTSVVDGRLPNLCADAYGVCGTTAGCSLDAEHYVEGVFPGALRVVVDSQVEQTPIRISFYLSDMRTPGTELLIQAHEPDCTTSGTDSRLHLEDIDLFELAGPDRSLSWSDLVLHRPGEHLLEIFSDATARYLLVVEPLPPLVLEEEVEDPP